MEDLTANTLADAVDQDGEGQVRAALNGLTRLSEGQAPGGWGQAEPIEENNQEPATNKKARKSLPRETIQSWSPGMSKVRSQRSLRTRGTRRLLQGLRSSTMF